MDLPQLAKLIDETTAFFKKEQEAILVQVNDPQQTEAGNAQMLQIQASTIQSAYRRIEAIQRAFSEWVETLPDKEQTEAPPLSGGAVTVDEPFLQQLLGQVEERFQSIEHGLDSPTRGGIRRRKTRRDSLVPRSLRM